MRNVRWFVVFVAAIGLVACESKEPTQPGSASSNNPSASNDDESSDGRVRTIEKTLSAERRREGGGFVVHRTIGSRGLSMLDPFLLLDEMGPVEYGPGEAKGAPEHPHKGFETVTYMLDGALTHEDSTGRSGTVGPGGVQWMTAGSGIVHSEMPSKEMMENGGQMHGFQLWVNLPKADKDADPNYQGFEAGEIPEATGADGKATARVVAGEVFGTQGAVETRTPITFAHLTVEPGGEVELPVAVGHNIAAYTIGGSGVFGPDEQSVSKQHMVVFDDRGRIALANPASSASEPLELLLLGGEPLEERVARKGPFVMNTEAELKEAIRQYRSGEMGRIE
jgi:redox-sensitive bicupin YhaK (pirin superfamily)